MAGRHATSGITHSFKGMDKYGILAITKCNKEIDPLRTTTDGTATCKTCQRKG